MQWGSKSLWGPCLVKTHLQEIVSIECAPNAPRHLKNDLQVLLKILLLCLQDKSQAFGF